jgi:hypothetical protein
MTGGQVGLNMANRYQKHYTRAEARALLPQIRLWLKRIVQLREDLERYEKRIASIMQTDCDAGGETVNAWVRLLADVQEVFMEFHRREIQIKDLSRGLIDFPALIGGKEVFLCWEEGEEDVEFWHDLDTGFAGREPL